MVVCQAHPYDHIGGSFPMNKVRAEEGAHVDRPKAFSKVKGILRKAKARTLEALFEATAEALGAVSTDDARGYFEHRGYSTSQDHPL